MVLLALSAISCVNRTQNEGLLRSNGTIGPSRQADELCRLNRDACICRGEYCFYLGTTQERQPISAEDRERFRDLLEQSRDPLFEPDPAAADFLAQKNLSTQFESYRAAQLFFKPLLALIYDREFQEAKARDKLRNFASLVASKFWNRSARYFGVTDDAKVTAALGLDDQKQAFGDIARTPDLFRNAFAQLAKVVPSMALIFTLTLSSFLGFMNAQCYGILEDQIKEPIAFIQYEATLEPKTQFEMFFFDCAANSRSCIHMAVRIGDKVYSGSGPTPGSGIARLPLPENLPLAEWNGDAIVYSADYSVFRDAEWGLSSKNSLTSVRIQLPEDEITNLKKYYESRLMTHFNYWAFPPLSTCTTVARDAIETTSLQLPPVVESFPGAVEAYMKLRSVFHDTRIVRIVRSNGEIAYGMTPDDIARKRAMHLGAQSAALLVTLPVTLFESKNIHFENGKVFDFSTLHLGTKSTQE